MNDLLNIKLKTLREKNQKKYLKKHYKMKTIMNNANLGEKLNPIGRVKDMELEREK